MKSLTLTGPNPGRPARNLVTILIKLSRLLVLQTLYLKLFVYFIILRFECFPETENRNLAL